MSSSGSAGSAQVGTEIYTWTPGMPIITRNGCGQVTPEGPARPDGLIIGMLIGIKYNNPSAKNYPLRVPSPPSAPGSESLPPPGARSYKPFFVLPGHVPPDFHLTHLAPPALSSEASPSLNYRPPSPAPHPHWPRPFRLCPLAAPRQSRHPLPGPAQPQPRPITPSRYRPLSAL